MFKLFYLFLFSVTVSHAAGYPFEVSNNTMGQAYFDIFNSIGGILNSNSYLSMLKLLFLIGGFFIFALGVFNISSAEDGKSTVSNYFKYMIAGTMLMLLVLSPSKDELIVFPKASSTSYSSQAEVQVNYSGFTVSLPGILPWYFSAVNQIGVSSTELAASAYSGFSSDPNVDKSMKETTVKGFGSQLNAPTKIFSITKSDLQSIATGNTVSTTFGTVENTVALATLSRFYTDCINMGAVSNTKPILSLAHELYKTGDIVSTTNDYFTSNVINHYEQPFGAPILVKNVPANDLIYELNDSFGSCKAAWNEVYFKAIQSIESENLFIIPSLTNLSPASIYTMTGDVDLTNLGSVNRMITQAAMISTVDHSISGIYKDMEYAKNKTMIETALKQSATGTYMAETLPYLQMGIRAVLYAFFPFVFLVILLPGGFSVAKNYAQSMIWVELWSPVAAILNLFLSYFSIDKMSDSIISGTTKAALMSDSIMLSGVAGYLYTMVPALTWLILKSSGDMLGNIGSSLASSYSKNLDSANLRKDFADIEKLNSYNKNAGVNDFINRAEQIKLDTLSSGIQGATLGKEISHSGGMDAFKEGMSNSKAQRDIKDISYANSSSFEAQKALAASEAIQEVNTLTATGAIDKNGNVDMNKINEIEAAQGAEKASDSLRSLDSMSHIAKKLGADLNTFDGRQKTSQILAYSKSAMFKGDIAEQEAQARQYALANDTKINGKDPSEATFSEVMKYAATAEQDIGTQKGVSEAVESTLKSHVLNETQTIKNISTVTKNAAFMERVDRLTTSANRATNSAEDIAADTVSKQAGAISTNKQLAESLGSDSVIDAAKEIGELSTKSSVWSAKGEEEYRNQEDISIEKEIAGNTFEATQQYEINEYMKKVLEYIPSVNNTSVDRGQIYAMLSLAENFEHLGLDKKYKNHKKFQAGKKQKAAVKKVNKLNEKLMKETDLAKREKLKTQKSKFSAEIVKQELVLNKNTNPKIDAQRIVDQVNHNDRGLLTKIGEMKDSIKSKDMKEFVAQTKDILKGGASTIKDIGVSTAKGAIVGVAIDLAVDELAKNVNEGTIAHDFVMSAKLLSNIVNEGISVTVGDTVPYLAALGLEAVGYNTAAFQASQVADMQESQDRFKSGALMQGYTAYLNKNAREQDNGIHYYYSFENRTIMKLSLDRDSGKYEAVGLLDQTDYSKVDLTDPASYQKAMKFKETIASVVDSSFSVPDTIEGISVREKTFLERAYFMN